MKIVTVSEMVEIEKASDAAGHSYDAMMELAGRAVAAAVIRHMNPWDSNGDVLVLAGPGNNGGDGLVAARYLRHWEPSRELAVYCWKRDPKDDRNYDAVRRLKIPIIHAEKDPGFERLRELVDNADVILDGLLGTGVSRPIEGTLAELLQAVHDAMVRRTPEEDLADEALDASETTSPHTAATALQPAADFDFLRLPPYTDLRLPQVVAVDCPSGLNCDTGKLDPAALPADLTVTFANPKVGHVTSDGPNACGRLEIADIGTDPELAGGVQTELVTPAYAKSLLPGRPPDSHKGTFGKAMVVAGSINYTGAVHLAGLAAYRTGAGLVTLAVIPSLQALLAAGLVETTWLLLPEQLGVVSPNALPVLADNLDGYRALLVGPGLSQEQEAVRFVHGLLGVSGERKRPAGFLGGQAGKTAGNDEPPRDKETAAQDQDEGDSGSAMGFLARHRSWATHSATEAIREMPLVLDADALNALSQVDDWHQAAQLPANSVLTPHPGEMGRLCGCSTREVQADRLGLARSKAAEWQQVVLLKGAYTVIAAPDGRVAVLPFANPALATAGSGDVLSGTILGLLSQGMAGFEAAVLGGYLHGLAGELARSEIGEAGVVAGDLLDRLPRAIRHLRAA